MPNRNLKDEKETLWSFDIAAISERALIERPELEERYEEYELELRKFFALVAKGDGPLGMFSPRVDALWHSLITYTPLYRKFCSEAIGFFVDHVPRTKSNPIPESAIWNFFAAYEESFGEVPELWFDGLPIEAIDDLKNRRIHPALLWSGWVPSRF